MVTSRLALPENSCRFLTRRRRRDGMGLRQSHRPLPRPVFRPPQSSPPIAPACGHQVALGVGTFFYVEPTKIAPDAVRSAAPP